MKLSERVKEGWSIRADGFSRIVREEFKDGLQKKWKKVILDKAPHDGILRIIDVGTGPGFFAMLLSQAGHRVTGIDASAEMIACAKENCVKAGVSPELRVCDSHNLDFPDGTFDMVVSRNVVWTLIDPVKAYYEWYRVLKQEGRLLVFDGNWAWDTKPEIQEQAKRDRDEYIKKYGDPLISYTNDEEDKARGWMVDMPLYHENRPEWDEQVLSEIGCRNIGSKFTLDEVFDEKRKLLYRANPPFMIWADK
jgi:ubiquinone/menaquinone biosynthesis C-methylase UbiE